jgi:hypothetical protein
MLMGGNELWDEQQLMEALPEEPKLSTHTHQMQCFISLPHPRHMIPVGVFQGTAYFYRCLGKD